MQLIRAFDHWLGATVQQHIKPMTLAHAVVMMGKLTRNTLEQSSATKTRCIFRQHRLNVHGTNIP